MAPDQWVGGRIAMTPFEGIQTRQRYRQLPDTFYSHVRPTPLRGDVRLVHFNEALAREMGLPPDSAQAWTGVGAGCALVEGMEPVAMKYTGHQFGMYNPELGDGRGLLLWETVGPDGTRWDCFSASDAKAAVNRTAQCIRPASRRTGTQGHAQY